MVPALLWLQDTVAVTVLWARRTLLRVAVLLCVLALELWVAVFLYGSFYYSYVPSASFATPVHIYYGLVSVCYARIGVDLAHAKNEYIKSADGRQGGEGHKPVTLRSQIRVSPACCPTFQPAVFGRNTITIT